MLPSIHLTHLHSADESNAMFLLLPSQRSSCALEGAPGASEETSRPAKTWQKRPQWASPASDQDSGLVRSGVSITWLLEKPDNPGALSSPHPGSSSDQSHQKTDRVPPISPDKETQSWGRDKCTL